MDSYLIMPFQIRGPLEGLIFRLQSKGLFGLAVWGLLEGIWEIGSDDITPAFNRPLKTAHRPHRNVFVTFHFNNPLSNPPNR